MKRPVLPGKVFLIPSNLDLEKIIASNPPTFEYSKDFFIYIINLIYQIPARNKDITCKWGYVPINAQELQRWDRNYRDYLDYLVTNEIFKENRQFFTGKKSRGFRFGQSYYKSPPIEVTIHDQRLLRKIEKRFSIKNDAVDKYPNLCQWFNEDLKIDVEAAKEFCQAHFEISEKSEREDLLNLQCTYQKIYALKNHHYWFTVDTKGNRLHTNLTNLDSALKPFITYKGQRLVAVDIKNSQPFLSIKVLKDYYQSQLTIITNSHSNPITLVNCVEDIMPPDVLEYVKLVVSGKFYEELISKFTEKFGRDYFSQEYFYDFDKGRAIKNTKSERQQVKAIIFAVFFSKNSYKSKAKELFREIFPNVMRIFEEMKKVRHNALACELQRLEASLVLDMACAEISLNRPDLPLFTIHDSIITTKGNEKYVGEVLQKYFLQEIGYTPKLDYDCWEEQNLKRAA